MLSWWILVVCIVGAFTFGVLVMAMLQLSAIRDRIAEDNFAEKLSPIGLHPLDSPSQT